MNRIVIVVGFTDTSTAVSNALSMALRGVVSIAPSIVVSSALFSVVSIALFSVVSIGLGARVAAAQPHGPEGHIPAPPAQLEQLLHHQPFEIRAVKDAGGGTTGAKRLTLYFPSDDLEVKVKWKRVPAFLDGVNNSPRRELATYEIQKWFLDPVDYVVPTSAALCVPLATYEPVDDDADGNIEDFECVLGIAAVWLDGVTVPDDVYDEERFRTDKNYAYHMANFNLLTYLVHHKDGRDGNFLTSQDESNRRIFAIDNGISFGGFVQNWFVSNWHKVRVEGLRAESIERLRKVGPEQLQALEVVAELAPDAARVLRSVEHTASENPRKGYFVSEQRVQLGVKESEIKELRARIDELLAKVDAGKIPTF